MSENSKSSAKTNKRARSQAVMSSVLDDDLRGLMDATFESTDEFNDLAMKKLQRETAREKRLPITKPYHEWPEAAKRANEMFISHVATLVEKRTVTPDDPALLERMRKTEAAMASEMGVASVSIYDARRPDPDYARHRLTIGQKNPNRTAGPFDHAHLKHTTRITEIRHENDFDPRKRIPADVVETERFTDACIAVDCQRALHNLDTYDQARRAAIKISELLAKGAIDEKDMDIKSFVRTLKLECSMPIFCVRFLHDATVEICFHMESNASYFAIFAFSIDAYVECESKKNHTTVARELEVLHSRICTEVSEERDKSEKRLTTAAALLEAPLDTLNKTQLSERSKLIADEKEFRALADKFHVRYNEAKEDEKDERKIAKIYPLAVFAVNKSEILLSLPCKYLYMYFATCQCLLDAPDESASKNDTGLEVRDKSTTVYVDGMALTSSVGYDFTKPLSKR